MNREYDVGVSDETQRLEKELAMAKAEIQSLRLRLDNLTYTLSEEMTASGRLPTLGLRRHSPDSKML